VNLWMLEHPEVSGIFNCGTGRAQTFNEVAAAVINTVRGSRSSVQELAEALLRTMGSDLDIEYGPERAVNGVTRRLADTSAAEREIGFKAEIGLEEGLTQLVEWWRAEKALGREPALVGTEAS
jgi:UDP-glucose 4-epimerase